MIYSLTKTVELNTPKASPKQYKMPVTNGLIYQVEVYFPPGSSGLMGVSIRDGGYWVWPSEPGEYFFGDNTLITFPDKYYVSSPMHILDVYAYNEDDTYGHIFQVRLGQANNPDIIASYIPAITGKNLQQIIGDMIAGQEKASEEQRQSLIDFFSEGSKGS